MCAFPPDVCSDIGILKIGIWEIWGPIVKFGNLDLHVCMYVKIYFMTLASSALLGFHEGRRLIKVYLHEKEEKE